MKLIVAHQVLIGAAIALAVLFGARAATLYARGGERDNLVFAGASALIAIALGFYLRTVRRKVREAKGQGNGK